jgi:uncharacterized protein YgiM (DUF1202 family)
MAQTVRSFLSFATVIAVALGATITALSFTADTVARTAAESPPVARNLRPSYVAFLPKAEPEAFNIARTLPVNPIAAPVAVAPPAATPAFTHTVLASSLRVRAGPQKTTPQVFVLEEGAEVTALGTERGWIEIRDRDGRTGWVYGKYLTATGPEAKVN